MLGTSVYSVISGVCNNRWKPFQLKQHLINAYPQNRERDRTFLESKLTSLKRVKLDETGTYQQTSKNTLYASYVIVLQVSKAKKAHTIGESLLKPCILEIVRLVLGEKASNKMKLISMFNDTIKTRVDKMSGNIKGQVVSNILPSPFFALQLDESTDVANISQLLVFCRYIIIKVIEQQFFIAILYK